MLEPNLYVACLNLRKRRALVVGGGPVALEKIEGLLACETDVTVVATKAVAQVMEMAEVQRIVLHERGYQTTDLDGCFLVIAATSDTELNTRIYREAEERSMLVNVVDVPHLCNFILPAIVRNDMLTIAISTAGASPALAKRMKREATEMFGPEYAQLALLLDGIRAWAKERLPTYEDRKVFFEEIVNGEPDPLELLRSGDLDTVQQRIADAQEQALTRLGDLLSE